MQVELAEKVRTYIFEHPEEHSQVAWGVTHHTEQGSRTMLCAAGITCKVAGAELVWDKGVFYSWCCYVRTQSLPKYARVKLKEDGPGIVYMPRAAQALLGIDDEQTRRLFYKLDSRAEVLEYMQEIIDKVPA